MAKDEKRRIPKRIAGVKVPKKLRKTANKALAIAETPAARELAIAALTAAAAALAERKTDAKSDPSPAGTTAEDVREQALKLGDLVIAAALEGARRLLDGLESPPVAAGPKRRRSANGGPAARAAAGDD